MKYQICFSASNEVKKYLKEKSKKTGYSVSSIINNTIMKEIHKNQSSSQTAQTKRT